MWCDPTLFRQTKNILRKGKCSTKLIEKSFFYRAKYIEKKILRMKKYEKILTRSTEKSFFDRSAEHK